MSDGDLGLRPNVLALIGDVHGNVGWTVEALHYAAARGAEVAIQLGSLTYPWRRRFFGRTQRACADLHLPLLFVDGCGEDYDRLLDHAVDGDGVRRLNPWMWHLPRGLRWTWAGVRFLALGGAQSASRKHGPAGSPRWPQRRITPQEADAAMAGGRADVMLCHDRPAGVDIPAPALHSAAQRPGAPTAAATRRQVLVDVVTAVAPRVLYHGHCRRSYTDRVTFDPTVGPTHVRGLDCEESTYSDNVCVVTLTDLQAVGAWEPALRGA